MIKFIAKHKILIVFLCVFLILISVYIALLIDTNSILQDVKSTYYGEKAVEEIEGTELESFYIHNPDYERNIATVDLKITRYFVVHNYSKGWILARVYCEARSAAGEVQYGEDTLHRWWIEKKDGKWIITDIKTNIIGGGICSLFE